MANGRGDFLLLINEVMLDEERQQLQVERRQLRDASNPFTLPEETFRQIYRLSRALAQELGNLLVPYMRVNRRQVTSIPNNLKIFVTLQFFAHGSYQKIAGQDYHTPMSQASVSRCLVDVMDAIQKLNHLISFPITQEQCALEKQGFMEMPNGFPGIIGVIDCTHVSIVAPPREDPEYPSILFLNRKGYYSLNVQIICNSKLKILAVNARYPGSVHDSAIWQTSQIRRELQRMYQNGNSNSWLIGDSGYPLEPWLMTPIRAPQNVAEQNYNIAHRSVRNIIERLNGVLKSRFRCLSKHRVLHYSPPKAARIINSCAILHNLCIARNEVEVVIDELPDFNEDLNEQEHNLLYQGRNTRNRIIQLYF